MRRSFAVLLAALLVLSFVGPAPRSYAAETCIHIDVKVYADGMLIADGPKIAIDGGFGHAGTGVTFIFQAKTYSPAYDACVLRTTDRDLTWSVVSWPCQNRPKPPPLRTASLRWTVKLPIDCELSFSPGNRLLTPTGQTVHAGRLLSRTAHTADAYNLTVNNLHTYYVLAGSTPVLVHNVGPGCGEEVLDQFSSFEQARNRALDLLGEVDPATRERYVGRLRSSTTTYGKVVGFTTDVDGQFKRFRLDYDPVKGPHINVEIGRGATSRKWAVPWSGTEEDFARILGGNS